MTARGWEDLSSILFGYEELGLTPDEKLIRQYIQDDDIARDFAVYYQLYAKYRKDYPITELLAGNLSEKEFQSVCGMASSAPSDEQLSVCSLLLDGWNRYFLLFEKEDHFVIQLQETLSQAKAALLANSSLTDFAEQYRNALKIRRQNQLLDGRETDESEKTAHILENCLIETRKKRLNTPEEIIDVLRTALSRSATTRKDLAHKTQLALKQGFAFAKTAFHDGPELLFLISDLSHNSQAMSFIRTFGCEEYFVFSKKLEFQKERAQLLQEIDAATFNFRG